MAPLSLGYILLGHLRPLASAPILFLSIVSHNSLVRHVCHSHLSSWGFPCIPCPSCNSTVCPVLFLIIPISSPNPLLPVASLLLCRTSIQISLSISTSKPPYICFLLFILQNWVLPHSFTPCLISSMCVFLLSNCSYRSGAVPHSSLYLAQGKYSINVYLTNVLK